MSSDPLNMFPFSKITGYQVVSIGIIIGCGKGSIIDE